MGHKHRTCSKAFLDALLADFVSVRDAFLLEKDAVDEEQAMMCLRKMFLECDRLYNYPLLFRTILDEDEFFKAVQRYATQIADAVADGKKRGRAELNGLGHYDQRFNMETRPFYVSNRKPWSQFLGNGAPGSGTT